LVSNGVIRELSFNSGEPDTGLIRFSTDFTDDSVASNRNRGLVNLGEPGELGILVFFGSFAKSTFETSGAGVESSTSFSGFCSIFGGSITGAAFGLTTSGIGAGFGLRLAPLKGTVRVFFSGATRMAVWDGCHFSRATP
jgi:hypothetical protein